MDKQSLKQPWRDVMIKTTNSQYQKCGAKNKHKDMDNIYIDIYNIKYNII